MAWWVYLLRCGNGDVYVGLTDNLERRLKEHQSGVGGRFTKGMRPVELIYSETHATETEAVHREEQLKRWSRTKKLALAAGDLEALKIA